MSLFTQPNDFSSNGGQADADSRDRTDTPNGASVWLWVCWLALAGTFAVFAAASYQPDARMWGVNHLAFFSPRIRLVVLGVTALFFVPPFAAVAWRGLLWLFRPFFRGLESGVNAIALSGVVALVVFAAFRSSTKLLGDGYFIAANFRGAADQGWSIRDYFEQVTLSERVYPVTELINYFASSVGVRFGASPDGGMWILNCVLGAAVLVGLLTAISRTGWPDAVKLLLLTLTLISGAIELFFGYIEHYTVAMALGAVYIATALRAVSGEGRVATPGLILLAGVLCHVQSLLLMPSDADRSHVGAVGIIRVAGGVDGRFQKKTRRRHPDHPRRGGISRDRNSCSFPYACAPLVISAIVRRRRVWRRCDIRRPPRRRGQRGAIVMPGVDVTRRIGRT